MEPFAPWMLRKDPATGSDVSRKTLQRSIYAPVYEHQVSTLVLSLVPFVGGCWTTEHGNGLVKSSFAKAKSATLHTLQEMHQKRRDISAKVNYGNSPRMPLLCMGMHPSS
jgi:hypothetical protein